MPDWPVGRTVSDRFQSAVSKMWRCDGPHVIPYPLARGYEKASGVSKFPPRG